MIFLKQHKIVFLKAQKVAGTSFEIALSKYAGDEDIITAIYGKDEALRKSLGFRSAQNAEYSLSEILSSHKLEYLRRRLKGKRLYKYRNHMSAEEAFKKLGREVWDSSVKVSIVRNPYDFVVSNYFWRTKGKKTRPEFSEWFYNNPHLINNNYAQYFIDGKDVIDFYIRFENFEVDIPALERQVESLSGLYETFASINAKGNIRPAGSSSKEFFRGHDDIVKVISEKNRYIIDKFGYEL
ncbi:sulfotransferase family 2 domain-containing protein [Ostreiculturibacter nitratireducens]|uniref:sulfotransferase family 2 domain-containing protein n=1 Tax=Ostreiculturibacter nitratireducens TaxID=3075226 RepID=UPI0031B64395